MGVARQLLVTLEQESRFHFETANDDPISMLLFAWEILDHLSQDACHSFVAGKPVGESVEEWKVQETVHYFGRCQEILHLEGNC